MEISDKNTWRQILVKNLGQRPGSQTSAPAANAVTLNPTKAICLGQTELGRGDPSQAAIAHGLDSPNWAETPRSRCEL
ncbi:MAG: hypothetical protein AAF773_27780 [Cyanobacteria bacterium P01_D01_bin.115]